ncbi:MAG: hypothetical protein R3C25_00195 [Hyphomonadaceae bacterium]
MRPFSLSDQQRAIAADWTSFRIVSEGPWWTTWEGVLTPNKTSYRVQVTLEARTRLAWGAYVRPQSIFPRVVVLSPRLEPRNGYLPHVYMDREDPPASPLCLHLPTFDQWRPGDPLTETTLPWASLWLFYYEFWRETDVWIGGGMHVGEPEYEAWRKTQAPVEQELDAPARAGPYRRSAHLSAFRMTGTFASFPLMAAASKGFLLPPSWHAWN